jgi:hypothetical protein
MPAVRATPESEMTILNRLIRPERNNLSSTAARAILKIDFDRSDRERMRELSQKARDGTLSRQEKVEIDSYEVVGHLLGLLHSKARRSLKRRNGNGA